LSNYLSQEFKIQAPTSNVDKQLVGQSLQILQGNYNINSAEIDKVLATYNTKLKGLRSEDNEYIAARLKEVTSAIDQYKSKNANLAYKSTKDSILTAATSLMGDPLIIDAITSTQNLTNYDAGYQALIKKDPKLANPINYEYGKYQAGFQDYMQGKTKKLGQIQYSPAVDLTEENLKKLKTIKDIKGKRFVEIQDPNNPGQIIRKEIDGLEDWQINQYLSSTMSAPELQQMRINSWSKFGGNNIEANRSSVVRQYDDYKNQKVTYLTNQKTLNDSIISNSSASDSARSEAKRKSGELAESIADLKAMDASVLDTTTIASTLERANYLNGISQLAQAEWSSEFKKNDVYFENQKLDLDKQKFDLDVQKFGLENSKFELDQFKTYRELGVDAQGNPITSGVVSQTPMASQLAETIATEGTGQGTLLSEHNKAYNNILNDASAFVQTGNDEDVNTLKAELNLRGVEVVGNQFKFKNPANNINNS